MGPCEHVCFLRVLVVVKDKLPEVFLGQDSVHLYFSKISLTHTDYAFIGYGVAIPYVDTSVMAVTL